MKLEEQETPATPPSPPHYMYIPYQVAVNQSPDNEMKYYTSYTNNALLFRTEHRVPITNNYYYIQCITYVLET